MHTYHKRISMKVCVLGSSSSGNATYLDLDGIKLLIDAGLPAKIIVQRLAEIGVSVPELTGIFVTHEHTDHISGIKGLLSIHPVPVYCTRHTASAIESILNVFPEFYLFTSGERFKLDQVKIEAFSVFHDAHDPVGFCFDTAKHRLGFVSDLGYVTSSVTRKLSGSNIIIIESNHDPKLLLADPKRPWQVKQRIKSRQGHLSNETACELMESVAHPELYHVVLFHLSVDCNRPEIAYAKMRECLDHKGFFQTHVHLTHPDKMSPVIVHPECTPPDERFSSCEQLEIPMVT